MQYSAFRNEKRGQIKMKKRKMIILMFIFSLAFVSFGYSGKGEFEISWIDIKEAQESKKKLVRHKIPPKESIFHFERQVLTINDFDAQGYILDIGGGGEGVIGQLKGQQVIAIDIFKEELEEAPDGPLKIIMDARDLKFLDNTFNTGTSFFTMMYIDGSDHEKVFKEIFRVLVSGGRFLIWDTIFRQRPDEKKEFGLVTLRIKLPNKEILAGYGVRWPEDVHDLSYYVQLAEQVGFKVAARKEKNHLFFLELHKP